MAPSIHRGGVYADEAINNDNNNQDSMKAIQDYTRAISLGAVDCYKETTSVHLRAGHYKEAVADAGMALAKCKLSPPQRAELLADRGRALSALRQYRRALNDYNNAIDCYPHNHIDYRDRAAILVRLNSYDKAITDLKTSIELCPVDDAPLYKALAEIYAHLGRNLEAQSACKKALGLLAGNLDGSRELNERAWTNIFSGNHKQAEQDAIKALAISYSDRADQAASYDVRGFALANSGRLKEAMADYNQAISLSPDRPMFHFHKANLCRKMGDEHTAASEMKIFEHLLDKRCLNDDNLLIDAHLADRSI